MGHVFISFSTADTDFAHELRDKIQESLGADTWIFTRSQIGGYSWVPEIDRAIDTCSSLVVIMTPDAAASLNVTYEWAYALGNHKPVMVVLLKGSDDYFHPRLQTIQFNNFRTGHEWERFLADLNIHIARYEESMIIVPRDASNPLRRAAHGLEDLDPNTRIMAVKSIAALAREDPNARDILAQVVDKLDYPETCIQAGLALGSLGDSRGTPGLARALVSGYDHTPEQSTAIQLAGQLRDQSLLPALLQLLDNKHLKSTSIISAIGKIGGPEAVKRLIIVLTLSTDDERSAAADALGELREESAVPSLVGVLNEPQRLSTEVRSSAALALGRIGNNEAVNGLIARANDTDPLVRQTVICALGIAGNLDAVPVLIRTLKDTDPAVKASAAVSIGKLKAREATNDLLPLLGNEQTGRRIRDQELIGGRSTPHAAAVWALQQFEDEKVLEILRNRKLI